MTIFFSHIRVKNNVPHLLTPPYFDNRRVTAEKVVSKGVTINNALIGVWWKMPVGRATQNFAPIDAERIWPRMVLQLYD